MTAAPDVARLAQLRRAKDVIDRAYAEPLDVRTVAATAGYSLWHFVRAFRAAYGESPGRYLSRRRVERAQDLLRTANLTVTEICHLVGFSSLGSFSARFTELVGESPTAYRNRVLASSEPPVPGCFVLMWRLNETAQSGRSAPAGSAATVPSEVSSDWEVT